MKFTCKGEGEEEELAEGEEVEEKRIKEYCDVSNETSLDYEGREDRLKEVEDK